MISMIVISLIIKPETSINYLKESRLIEYTDPYFQDESLSEPGKIKLTLFISSFSLKFLKKKAF